MILVLVQSVVERGVSFTLEAAKHSEILDLCQYDTFENLIAPNGNVSQYSQLPIESLDFVVCQITSTYNIRKVRKATITITVYEER